MEVRVAVWQQPEVTLIPAGALFREGNAWKTFVYDTGHSGSDKEGGNGTMDRLKSAVGDKVKNGVSAKAKKIDVEAGRTDGRQTQVLGGIEVGTMVLLHPPDSVKDGVAVIARGEG